MKLAFWKGKQSRRNPAKAAPAGVEPNFESASGDADADEAHVHQLRARARRRMIGAAALLLLLVILVPMLLDPTPRPIPENIPIELPSDRTPFAPKLVAPPAEAPGAAREAAGSVPAAPGSAADAAAVAGEGVAAKSATGAEPAKPDVKPEAKSPPHKTEARTEPGGRIFVQAAALAKESAALELASRLGKSGLASFVERTESNGNTRYRVRLGPFATRDEAERARTRLHELGVSSNIVVA
jgi:DedD protein